MSHGTTDPKELAIAGMDAAWKLVLEFQLLMGEPTSSAPVELTPERLERRVSWMASELEELRAANDLVGQVDAAVDLVYFLLGTLVEMGVPLGAVFAAVHQANVTKIWPDGAPRFSQDGKLLKPPGWIGPEAELATILHNLLSDQPGDRRS